MKKFLLEISLFALLIIAVLSCISYYTDKGFTNGRYASFKVWEDIYGGKINADVLIQGNSHAYVQISPAILDSVLNTNSYNIGQNGSSFDFQSTIYSFYRAHNRKPKMIIQCIDYKSFEKTEYIYNHKQLLAFAGDSIFRNTPFNFNIPWYNHYLPFLKWQKDPEAVLMGISSLLDHPLLDTFYTYKGYISVNRNWNKKELETFTQKPEKAFPEFNKEVFSYFCQFLENCQRDSIKVALVFTPYYYQFSRNCSLRLQYTKLLQLLSEQYHVLFLDYNNDSICNNSCYFYNASHLNKTGAEIFSRKLAADLKTFYISK